MSRPIAHQPHNIQLEIDDSLARAEDDDLIVSRRRRRNEGEHNHEGSRQLLLSELDTFALMVDDIQARLHLNLKEILNSLPLKRVKVGKSGNDYVELLDIE